MNEESKIELTEEVFESHIVVRVSGQLDVTSGNVFEKFLTTHIHSEKIAVVIDMRGVEYLSSAGLRSLLLLVKQSRQYGTQLFFCNLSSFVNEIFEVSGFSSLMTVFSSLGEAVRQVGMLR